MNDTLDVEDAEQRFSRLQSTLEKLNATSSSMSSQSASAPNFSFLNKDPALSRPQHIQPPTELLSRVHAFLPALEASNAFLSTQDPRAIDIESIDSSMDNYIEMNLGLGLFDVRGSTASMPISTPFPVSMSTSSSSSYSSTSCSSSASTSSSSDDYESDSESDVEIITSFVPIRPTKPLPRRATHQPQQRIVMLSQTEPSQGTQNGEGG